LLLPSWGSSAADRDLSSTADVCCCDAACVLRALSGLLAELHSN
jgi:hypothetical protein